MSQAPLRWDVETTIQPIDLMGLMPYLVLVDAVFSVAEDQLTLELFDRSTEEQYALAWASTLELRRKRHRAPTRPELEHHLVRAAKFEGADIEEVTKIVNYVFKPETTAEEYARGSETGLELLQKFLLERRVSVPVRDYLAADQFATIPSDLPGFLRHHAQEAERLSAVNQLRGISAYAEDMFQRTEEVFATTSTGFRFLDEAMSGGTTAAEINAVIAPTDGGKTLTAICLGKGHAMQQRMRHQAGQPYGLTVYFTYETDSQDVRLRLISSLCQISMQSLMSVRGESELSRAPNYKPYELTRFRLQISDYRRQGREYPGEAERLEMHKDLLGNYFWICDMRSDGSDGNHQGRGYLGEMASHLDRLTQERQIPISMVLIDYAGLACERYMEARREKIDNKSSHLSRFGDHCRTALVDRFGCAVWAMQQASGVANTRSPVLPLKHTDTRDSKTFCDNMNYAVCLGVPDPRTRVQLMYLSKCKRRPATAPHECLVQLDSDVMNIKDVRDEYVLDAQRHQILPRTAHAQRIQGTTGDAGGPATGSRGEARPPRRVVRE